MVPEGLTYNQELALAIIGAVATILAIAGGIVAGVLISARQTAKVLSNERAAQAEEHRHQDLIDVERFMRGERLDVYRRLIAAASEVLHAESATNWRVTEEAFDHAARKGAVWDTVLAETRLVGSPAVVGAAQRIERVRVQRRHDVINTPIPDEDVFGPPEPVPGFRQFLVERHENLQLVEALVDPCRSDLGGLLD